MKYALEQRSGSVRGLMNQYSIILPLWINLFFSNQPSVKSSSDRFAPQATKLKVTEQDNSRIPGFMTLL